MGLSNPKGARKEWLEKVRVDGLKLESCPFKDDYEIAFIAVSQNRGALKFVQGSLSQDTYIQAAAGQIDFPKPDGRRVVCVSRRFVTDFSVKAVARIREHPSFKDYYIYNPSAYNKAFCFEKDFSGQPDWDRATDETVPCRGGETCGRRVCTRDGRPTNGSCWRHSFWVHLHDAKNSGGYLLQIVDLVNGRLQLGKGQEIEIQMALAIGANIIQLEQIDENESINGVMDTSIDALVQKHETHAWDYGFSESGIMSDKLALENSLRFSISLDSVRLHIKLGAQYSKAFAMLPLMRKLEYVETTSSNFWSGSDFYDEMRCMCSTLPYCSSVLTKVTCVREGTMFLPSWLSEIANNLKPHGWMIEVFAPTAQFILELAIRLTKPTDVSLAGSIRHNDNYDSVFEAQEPGGDHSHWDLSEAQVH